MEKQKKNEDVLKVVKEPEVLGPDPFDEISKKVGNVGKGESLSMAKALMEDIDHNYFTLGGILSAINENQWFEDGGYETFKVFVETELGVKYRKAMYLVSIYNDIIESGIPYEKIKGIGWTKLKEIAGILDEDNVDELVEKAESMNTLQLIEEVKAMGEDENEDSGISKEPSTIKSKVFKLHQDQRDVIDEAIEVAKVKIDTEFDAVALEHICLEYLSTGSTNSKSSKPSKQKKKVETDANEVDGDFVEALKDEDVADDDFEI